MWDDDETTEGGEVPPDSAVKPTSDQGLARERLDAFFDELDTVRFLSSAADQVGDEFRFGAEVRMNDADPDEFDCSELVEWSAHQAGVIVLSCGTFGNVLRFLPPLTISDDLLLEGLDVLADILADL